MKTRNLVLLIPCCAVLFACGPANTGTAAAKPARSNSTPTAAHATLAGAPPSEPAANPGKSAGGNLQFIATPGGVQLTGPIAGLKPNAEHGFHVHQTGDCSSSDFTSAGGHFNPEGTMHGAPYAAAHHLGDLAAVRADANGNASVSTTIAGATLNDGGPHDLVGKALIVHARPDDYRTQPSGNSGDRIACGVIEKLP